MSKKFRGSQRRYSSKTIIHLMMIGDELKRFQSSRYITVKQSKVL